MFGCHPEAGVAGSGSGLLIEPTQTLIQPAKKEWPKNLNVEAGSHKSYGQQRNG